MQGPVTKESIVKVGKARIVNAIYKLNPTFTFIIVDKNNYVDITTLVISRSTN